MVTRNMTMATEEDDDRRRDADLVSAQTALALRQAALAVSQTQLTARQSQTEFWKIGVAAVLAGAVFGGFVVQVLNMVAR